MASLCLQQQLTELALSLLYLPLTWRMLPPAQYCPLNPSVFGRPCRQNSVKKNSYNDQMGIWARAVVLYPFDWLGWRPAVTRSFCGGHVKLGGWLGVASRGRCPGEVDGSAAHRKSASPREAQTEVRTSRGIMRGVSPKAGNRARKSPPCGSVRG